MGKDFEATTPNSPVYLRNEDATQAANLCARSLVDFLDELNEAVTTEEKQAVITRARHEHNLVFDAFIYGVDYGRMNPLGGGSK